IVPSRVGPVLPESNNVETVLPVVNASGRGLNLSLSLVHNSKGSFVNGTQVSGSPLPSYPAAGFNLGFGYIVTYTSSFSPFDTGYMYIKPDGTPVYLGHGSASTVGTYTANDGSHIVYTGNALNGGSITFPNGSVMSMSVLNNYIQPTQMMDTNGDYMTFAYEDSSQGYSPLALASITDTLGRIDTFNYDALKRLSSISTPAQGGGTTQLWLFTYGTNSLTVEEGNQNGMSFTTGSTSQTIGIVRGGTVQASATFNYTSGSNPTLTGWSESPGGSYSITSSTNTSAKTITFTITRPDSSTLNLTRSTDTTSVANGLMTQSEIKNSSSASMHKTVFTYASDPGGGKQVTNTATYDDTGAAIQTAFQYNSGGFVTVKQEYGYSSSIQRQTNVSYVTAGGAFKPSEIDVYDETVIPAKPAAKKTYTYDNYAALGGMQDYGGTANPPGHLSGYDASQTNRGNVTGETDWYDIANNLSITRLAQI
ncbi:MAG: hypothetical protein ACREAC_11990, partial [Blastocatellia bacterium]